MVDSHRQQQSAEGGAKTDAAADDPFEFSLATDEVETLYEKLYGNHAHTSLLKRNLTPEVFERLKLLNTKFNGVLADCIRSGEML